MDPAARWRLTATYANATQNLDLDLTLYEPADGIVANLLGIEGRPPVALALKGSGPLSDLDLGLTLDANAERVLTGTTQIRRQDDGYGFTDQCRRPDRQIIPAQFRAFFGAETTLVANGLVRDAGGFLLDNLNLASAALTIDAAAETATDGFLQRLKLNAVIDDATARKGRCCRCPAAKRPSSAPPSPFPSAKAPREEWSGTIDIDELTTGTFGSDKVAIALGGLARNLSQPANRQITFKADGSASGIVADRADVQKRLATASPSTSRATGTPANRSGSPGRCLPAMGSVCRLPATSPNSPSTATSRSMRRASRHSPASPGANSPAPSKLEASGEVKPVGGGFRPDAGRHRDRPQDRQQGGRQSAGGRNPHHRPRRARRDGPSRRQTARLQQPGRPYRRRHLRDRRCRFQPRPGARRSRPCCPSRPPAG